MKNIYFKGLMLLFGILVMFLTMDIKTKCEDINVQLVTVEEAMLLSARTKSIDEIQKLTYDNEDKNISEQMVIADMFLKHMDKLDKDMDSEELEEWFLQYKGLVHNVDLFIHDDEPETIYDYYTSDELDRFFRVVQAEVGDEYSFKQKVNVASVILNRIESKEFGDSLYTVLTKDQFATISNNRYKEVEVSDVTILACEFAFEIMDTTNGALFFDNNGVLKYKFMFNDGAHNFYTIK